MTQLVDKKSKSYKAVSLLETLIYIAVFGLIFISVMQFLFMIVDSNRATQQKIEAERTKIFLLQHFESAFSKYDFVSPTSTFNATNCRLILDYNFITDATLVYSLDSDTIYATYADMEPSFLTPTEMIVQNFGCSAIYDDSTAIIGAEIQIEYIIDGNSTAPDSFTQKYFIK